MNAFWLLLNLSLAWNNSYLTANDTDFKYGFNMNYTNTTNLLWPLIN